MNISDNGVQLIKSFEGKKLDAYEDSVGIWTIGYGCIRYPDGTQVKAHDCCTEEEAENFMRHDLKRFIDGVSKRVAGLNLTQGMFDSLVSFSYNLGLGSLDQSTLLKKIKVNPNDPTIYTYKKNEKGEPVVDSCEFLRWARAGGRVIKGLVLRRAREADTYRGNIIT